MKKLFDYSLALFLLLSPLFLFKTYYPSFARGLFFIIGTFALFGISLFCEPKRKLTNPYLGIILLLSLITVFFNESFGKNAEWFNFWISCAGFKYVFCGILLFYLVYTYIDKIYLFPILLVVLFNLIIVLGQLTGHNLLWAKTPSLCGAMETSSQLGQYSALSLPIVMYLHPILGIFPVITLIASKSVSAILATAVGMGVFCVLRGYRRIFLVGLVCLLVFFGIKHIDYVKGKFHCRPIMWKKTLKTALEKPYLGYGFKSFKREVCDSKHKAEAGSYEFARAHNDYLHTAQELGFPVLAAIIMFFVGLFKKFRKSKINKLTAALMSSVVIVLFNMAGQTLIRYASIAGTFIIITALLYVELEGSKNGDRIRN